MILEIISNENKLEHLQVDNDRVMFSKLSTGFGKYFLSYQGSNLTLRLTRLLEENQPLSGVVFIAHMGFLKYLIIY